jgi:hypothetical protein
MASTRESRVRIGAVVGTMFVVAISIWVRWPGLTQGGFASHDVGGILYNAMVLEAGELPYVADIEMKAPGSFYLAWAVAGDGTDIARLQVFANLWALLGVLAVAAIAWRHFGPVAAPVAAAIVALGDAHLDSMDANYVTWSQLPQVLAFGWAAAAAGHTGRTRATGFAIAGALAGAAMLVKQPTGIVLVALAICTLPSRGSWSRSWSATMRDWIAIGGGCLALHVPLVIHYAMAGALGDLLAAYPINRWGIGYVTEGGRTSELPVPVDGMLATVYFLALPLVLAGFAAWPRSGQGARGVDLRTPLLVWAACMIAAAWVGARFYTGYFLAALPPLALLAAAPWGLLGERAQLGRLARFVLVLPIVALLGRQIALLHETRVDRARPHDEGGRIVAKHLRRELPDDARIWVWGWHLWDVYAFTGRRSASRIYKSLGLLTRPNDDTWRQPATPLVFVDNEYAALLIEDLERTPPGYIVLGSTVPHRQFAALRRLLQRDYVRDHAVKIGRLEMWRHKSI